LSPFETSLQDEFLGKFINAMLHNAFHFSGTCSIAVSWLAYSSIYLNCNNMNQLQIRPIIISTRSSRKKVSQLEIIFSFHNEKELQMNNIHYGERFEATLKSCAKYMI